MKRSKQPTRLLIVLVLVAAAVAGCAPGDPVLGGPPAGDPKMPDLVADPPVVFRTQFDEGERLLLFTSTLTNVGDGDFLLAGTEVSDEWQVEQLIQYTESGTERIPVSAEMEWGGDSHEHWHVARVSVHWLEALDEDGNPVEGFERRYDTKVGFCFFDSHHILDYGTELPGYESSGCGTLEGESFDMGLSRGWSDVYPFYLPGQVIDITGLPDGTYRLWAEADPEDWFRELDESNNRTWADIDISTRESDGAPLARVVGVGPRPSDF